MGIESCASSVSPGTSLSVLAEEFGHQYGNLPRRCFLSLLLPTGGALLELWKVTGFIPGDTM